MTRNGKIARLPAFIREQLNRRLQDGEEGKGLVTWLNDLPKVKEALEKEFDGRSISEQNLSEWKQGGFEDWQRQQDARAWVQQLAKNSGDLEEEAGDFSVNDWLSAPLAVALGRCLQTIVTKAHSDPSQLRLLLYVAREVSILRRGDHSVQRLRLEQERWEAEQEAKKSAMHEQRDAELQAAEARMEQNDKELRELYEEKKPQGTLSAEAKALCEKCFAEADEIRSMPSVRYRFGQFYVEPGKTKSDSIKPNQANGGA
jgi:hypothetical protein